MFVMDSIKVIGKIVLPENKNTFISCDDCGCLVNDSCGDPRHLVTTEYSDGKKEERMICDVCADEQFGDHEPCSIFDGTPDWMRYCY